MDIADNEEYWKQLHSNPIIRDKLPTEISKSWERSYQYGVSPNLVEVPLCSPTEFESQPNLYYMLDVTRTIAKHMLKYLPNEYAIVIVSQQICIMEIVAQEKVIQWLNKLGFSEGIDLSEKETGTNACALGMYLCKPISIVGYEHYCKLFIELGSAYAPIMLRHKPIGGIAILGPAADFERNSLGIAAMAARTIVSRMEVQRWSYTVNKSISEGVLWLNTQNQVLYMSRKCHSILKYPIQDTYNVHLESIINPSIIKNDCFWRILKSDQTIADKSMVLVVNNETINCNMTISSFESSDRVWSGKIIIIEAIERINKLIRTYTGNRARLTFNDVIGSDPAFSSTLEKARISASSFSNILLLGESGTGKDVIAQAIHNESPRRNGQFVAINCAALPRELISSELFGYENGAFTGAKRGGNMGKFELAHQGTIFLDEIGDMPADLQAMLLRVIEEKSVLRLGGNEPIPVDVRIIAATNKNLEKEIERNTFRRDLYYRLGVIRIVIPALRNRLKDIPELSRHFIHLLCKRLNLPSKTISPEVIDQFQSYHWPGNVRELQNVLENAVQWSTDSVISKELVEQLLSPLAPNIDAEKKPHPETISEKDIIMSYLKSFDYNKSKTAKALGISRKTLYNKLRGYDIPFES